jgi:hypothetical protein
MITFKGHPVKVIYDLIGDHNLVGIQFGKSLRTIVTLEVLPYYLLYLKIYETEPRTRKLEN